MSDFGRFLPLNGRPHGAEIDVSSDRREVLADIVERAGELVALEGDGDAGFAEAFIDRAELRPDFATVASEAGATSLLSLAAAIRSGKRRRMRALASGARALLLLARDLRADPKLDSGTAGTVALHLAASAPFDRRAVVKGHTIRATDADWSFGHGPVLEGTATGIAAFLLGVSDDPPQPRSITGPR